MNLALVCDVRVAGPPGQVRHALPADRHPPRRRPHVDAAAHRRAAGGGGHVLFGEVLDGAEAERVGLAWRCVDDDQLLAAAHEMAKKAADAPRELIIKVKETLATWPRSRPTTRRSTGSRAPGVVDAAALVPGAPGRAAGPDLLEGALRWGPSASWPTASPRRCSRSTRNAATFVGARRARRPRSPTIRPRATRPRAPSSHAPRSPSWTRTGTLGDDGDRPLRRAAARAARRASLADPRRRRAAAGPATTSARRSQEFREVFDVTPSDTPEEWETSATRLAAVPEAYEPVPAALRAGDGQGGFAAPRQAQAAAEQLAVVERPARARRLFRRAGAPGPGGAAGGCAAAATAATEAMAAFRRFLRRGVRARRRRARPTPSAGALRRGVRYWNGIDLDVDDAYAYGWGEFNRLDGELRAEAERDPARRHAARGDAPPRRAGRGDRGERGAASVAAGPDDEAIAALDGRHFDLAGPAAEGRGRLAPPGARRPPTTPRPRRTSAGRAGRGSRPSAATRFPSWEQVSTWYHEGVPGHHLQLAEWIWRPTTCRSTRRRSAG